MKRLLFVSVILMLITGAGWAAPAPAVSPGQPPPTDAGGPPVPPPHAEGRGFTARPRLVGALTSREAVSIALAQSLRAGIAREEALMATAERLMAASELGLKVSGTALGAVQNTSMIYATAPGVMPAFYARLADRNAADFNLMAMLPLFTGGRLTALLQGAREAEKAALSRQAWEMLDVAREARVAYARVVVAKQRLEQASWEVEQRTENLRLVGVQFAAGKVAQYVVMRARAELASARQMQNEARAGVETELAMLKSVLGVDMASAFDIVDGIRVPPAARAAEAEMKQALAERPDLLAARADVASAAQAIRAARARYAPQVYATGMLEQMYETGRGRPSEWNGGYSAGVVMSIPILDAGERRASVLRSEADKRRRDLQAQALELEVTRQVTEAMANLSAASENVTLALEEVDKAEEDLRVARLRFSAGRALHLEVIDALAALSRARLNRINVLFKASVARADLLRATGRLQEDE